MIRHTDLGRTRYAQLRALAALIPTGKISLGGHGPGKRYGRLDCRAGKRMKPENRVFFRDETEAKALGFRPCALCMRAAYKVWRQATMQGQSLR